MKTMNKWMLGVLLTGALASCEMKDELAGTGTSEAMGALQLGLSVKEPETARANNDVTTFPVEITCEDTPANSKTFASYAEIVELDNVVPLAAGTYVVKAHTQGTLAGFSIMKDPYYQGVADLTVTEGITEDVNVVCTLANTRVALDLPSDFDSFDSWTITLDDGNNHTLEFSNADDYDNHTAYWYLGETGVPTLNMNIEAVKEGVTYRKAQTLTKEDAVENFGENDNPNFVGGDALAINIDVTQEETPEQPEQPQIGFDVSVILSFLNHDESVTIPITPGSGDSGDDDDDPNQGGGGQEPDPEPSKAITISDNDTGYLTNGVTIHHKQSADYPKDVAVVMNIKNGIKKLSVKVETTNSVFEMAAGAMGLTGEDGLDLTSEDASELSYLFALPKVSDTNYSFTMNSTLFELLGGNENEENPMEGYIGKHEFILTVTDANDNVKSATLVINVVE